MNRTTSRRRQLMKSGPVVVALVGIGFLAAACGSGSATPGVASVGSTTTTTTATAGSAAFTPFASPQKEEQYDLSYAECMRSHGVSGFPDPTLSAHSGSFGLSFNASADSTSPQFASANASCKHLLPDGGGPPTPAQLATETSELLKYSKCMQTHGEPNFPDPTVSRSLFGFSLNGVNTSSPQFQAAQKACQSVLPGAEP